MPKKAVTLASIEDQLNSATPKWVCPVTGTKIEAADTKAIDAHKTHVLEQARKEEEKKKVAKAKRDNLRLLESSSSEKLVRQALVERIRMSYPNFKEEALPSIFIPRCKGQPYRVYLGIQKPSSKVIQGQLKAALGLQSGISTSLSFVDSKYENQLYMPISSGSFLGKALAQKMCAKIPKKLDPSTKAQLWASNPEYQEKMKQMLEAASALSSQRARVAALNQELEDMRKKVLQGDTLSFD